MRFNLADETIRSFTGGITGCFFGITVSWSLIALLQLPTAAVVPIIPTFTFFGVVIGWWYDQTVAVLAESYADIKQRMPNFGRLAETTEKRTSTVIGTVCNAASSMLSWLGWVISTIFESAGRAGKVVVKSPGYLLGWLQSHPMNRAKLIKGLVFAGFIIGVPIMVYYFAEPALEVSQKNRGGPAILGFFAAGVGMLFYVILDQEVGGKASELSAYYREWEILSRYGSFGFFSYVTGRYLLHTLGAVVYIGIALPWLVGVSLLGMFAAMPLVAVLATGLAFYRLARKPGYVLCFLVTLAAVGLSWVMFQESFSNPIVHGIVVTAASITSGTMTVLLRKVGLWLFANTRIGRTLIKGGVMRVMDERPSEELLGRGYIPAVARLASVWVRQTTAGHLLRSACFGASWKRSVKIV